jgi:hypothetical protein
MRQGLLVCRLSGDWQSVQPKFNIAFLILSEDVMAEDLMRYDQLAQNALRGVVREALRKVQKTGLPGDHHFYIAFNTRFPGVALSERIAARYPREMTVVLQHQFWNLVVTEELFEVELSFDNIPEKLVVPFNAVKGFLDPSVQFGLQFEVVQADGQTDSTQKPMVEGKTPPETEGETALADSAKPDSESGEAKVVSLDAFRKK